MAKTRISCHGVNLGTQRAGPLVRCPAKLFPLFLVQDENHDHRSHSRDPEPGVQVDYPGLSRAERESACRDEGGDCYDSDGCCLCVLLCSGVCSGLVAACVETVIRTL